MQRGILADTTKPPFDRLRDLVHAFLRSECDEAAVRIALGDAAPLYRDAPEAKTARASAARAFRAFMREALPAATSTELTLAGDLIMTTLSMVGKRFSEKPRTPAAIKTYADSMADMFVAYLKIVGRG